MNQGSPSVIQKSISLILNYPEAVEQIRKIEFVNYEKPGIKILIKLLKNITDQPNMNTAALIERWREDDEGKYLSKLAVNPFPKNTEFNASQELNSCLEQITKNCSDEGSDVFRKLSTKIRQQISWQKPKP